MARKTKAEAAATRDSILDAAEKLFAEQGVSRTTLQHIASEAGVTRGAIYWHFLDKGALLQAMMERAKMPLEEAMLLLDTNEGGDPMQDLREYVMTVLRVTASDPKARRVFEIVTLKMEFVADAVVMREGRREKQLIWMQRVETRLKQAKALGSVRQDLDPVTVANGMWIIMDGLIRNWLFDTDAYDLVELGGAVMDTYLSGLRNC
ncbi:TetR family transcriptional regulator [Telluria aromaticivorans]|uniref:TetR family transcriptional regulator n=1 Tax=Telluria aromaticivorans TaxID=2725995 RepID=A0A7Y2JXL4_9BURK|nr:TetR family transcriptional regulator [Telluria aromaticivorans]NNG22568.1 TetR family transcriptional regulator [Telluria aromaticivorans]